MPKLAFNDWLAAINDIVIDLAGVGVNDLVDWNSHDSWSSGDTPEEALDAIAEFDDLFAALLEEVR